MQATSSVFEPTTPMTPLESSQTVFLGSGKISVTDFAKSMILAENLDDNFYIYDLNKAGCYDARAVMPKG